MNSCQVKLLAIKLSGQEIDVEAGRRMDDGGEVVKGKTRLANASPSFIESRALMPRLYNQSGPEDVADRIQQLLLLRQPTSSTSHCTSRNVQLYDFRTDSQQTFHDLLKSAVKMGGGGAKMPGQYVITTSW